VQRPVSVWPRGYWPRYWELLGEEWGALSELLYLSTTRSPMQQAGATLLWAGAWSANQALTPYLLYGHPNKAADHAGGTAQGHGWGQRDADQALGTRIGPLGHGPGLSPPSSARQPGLQQAHRGCVLVQPQLRGGMENGAGNHNNSSKYTNRIVRIVRIAPNHKTTKHHLSW
jgi:hypothetical protein